MFNHVNKETAEKIVEALEEFKKYNPVYYEVGINDTSGFYFSWYLSADISSAESVIGSNFPELRNCSIDEIFDVAWMQR